LTDYLANCRAGLLKRLIHCIGLQSTVTRNSTVADKPYDAFSQLKSPNMVAFDKLWFPISVL